MIEKLRRALPSITAVLVVVHVASNSADVIPNPGSFNANNMKDPRAKAEVAAWAARLHLDIETTQSIGLTGAEVVRAIRKAIRLPATPYIDATGMGQSWSLFTMAARRTARFVVEARDCESCGWRTLHRTHDDDHAFAADVLENDRSIGAILRWTYPEGRAARDRACRLLARRAFAEDPHIVAVRCGAESWPLFRGDDPARDEALANQKIEASYGKTITRSDVDNATATTATTAARGAP